MRIGKLEKGVNGNIKGFRQLVEVALRSQDGGGQGDTSKVHVQVRVQDGGAVQRRNSVKSKYFQVPKYSAR